MSGRTVANGETVGGDLLQPPNVLVQVENDESALLSKHGPPMGGVESPVEGLELKGLTVPKGYDSKLSPLAGDTVPLDHIVVHPENLQLQASPAVGFSEPFDSTDSKKNDPTISIKVSSKRSSSITTKQQEKKLKLVNVSQRVSPHFNSVSSTCSEDMSITSTNVSLGGRLYHPLSTSSVRKGGCNVSAETQWDFDGRALLSSYFPDHEVTIFIGTWNMGELKVRIQLPINHRWWLETSHVEAIFTHVHGSIHAINSV